MTLSDKPHVTKSNLQFLRSCVESGEIVDSPPQRVEILASASGGPPNVIYPGFAFGKGDGAAALAALTESGSGERASRISVKGRPVLRLRPGVMTTPGFVAGSRWLSTTVVGGARDGRRVAGAASQALQAGVEPHVARRAAALADHLVAARIGGTCWANPGNLAGSGLTLIQASASPAATGAMLHGAVARAEAAKTVLLLREPPTNEGMRQVAARAAGFGCRVLHGPHDPWSLIELCSALHVADGAAIGFLALLAGRPVYCHAPAWLAGWGLTRDGPGVPDRGHRRGLAELAAAALLAGASYASPFDGQAITAEAAADIAAEWRRVGDANRGIGAVTGMQFWKRRRIAEFLHSGVDAPPYRRTARAAVAQAARRGGTVASWSSRTPVDLAATAAEAGVKTVRVEDGFIRSVGLGSNFLPPCSIILDGRGMYYDPSRPSDLEHLLATWDFDARLLARAKALVARLVRDGVTKYNVGNAAPIAFAAGRQRVLVPGQVANDLSVRLGGAGVTDNFALLAQVRAANPDAFIVYKPHPDVDAGHRPGAIADDAALGLADVVVRDASMAALIGAVDEVHTMTSLAGFEALLRGKRVVAWGQPFYAGWGLTDDMAPIARRARTLTLEQLAAGVLILYPRYVDPVTGMPCPVEVLMDRLAEPEHWRPGLLARLRRLEGLAHSRCQAVLRAGRRMMAIRRQA